MASVRRVLAVTAGLAAAGFVVGAVVGALVTGVALALSGLSPFEWEIASSMATAVAAAGVLGMVLGPIAAWVLMRHVPLGRALAQTALGTAVGAFLGFLPWAAIGIVIPLAPISLALVGFTAAAVRLRFTHRKKDAIPLLPPDV